MLPVDVNVPVPACVDELPAFVDDIPADLDDVFVDDNLLGKFPDHYIAAHIGLFRLCL